MAAQFNAQRRFAAASLLVLAALAGAPAHALVVHTYDNTAAGALSNAATSCATPLERTFTVTDSFTVSTIAIGINVSHPQRGDLRMTLVAPNNTTSQFVTESADPDDNYDAMFSSNSEGALDDGDADPVAFPLYSRLVTRTAATINFYTGNSVGTWRLRICDTVAANNGTFTSARLVLSENTTPALSVCKTTPAKLSVDWGANGDFVGFTSATTGGVTFTETTTAEALNDTDAGGFVTRTATTGNHTGYYRMQMDLAGGADGEGSGELAVFTFSVPVRDLTFGYLDNDLTGGAWEDHTRIIATDAAGVPVAYRMTIGAAAQQAGDLAEGDAAAGTTDTTGNVDFEFQRSVQTLTVNYAQGDDPATGGSAQFVGLSDYSFCAFDFGDAPTSYDTTLATAGARHVLGERQIYLGAAQPRGESDGQAGSTANLDGTEEDGVASFPTYVAAGMTCGSYTTTAGEYCALVNVTNAAGSDGQLVGWIDFNGDGDFDDSGELSLPRLGGGTGGAGDNSFATGNIPNGTSNQNRVLVWTPVGTPVNTATYARIRISTDATFFGATPPNNGQAADGEAEDYLLAAGTLPVTLAYLASRVEAGATVLEWSTATETANAGFRIYAMQGDSRTPAGPSLVPSQLGNAAEPSHYAARVSLPGGTYYLADVDIGGNETVHGPFEVGRSYGTRPVPAAIDWAAVRAEVDAARVAARAGQRVGRAVLWVRERGFQRVRYEDLAAAGVDLAGAPAAALAVTRAGVPVARHVDGAGVFGPGSSVEFHAETAPTLYNAETAYRIAADPAAALPIADDAEVLGGTLPVWSRAEAVYAPQRLYNFGSPIDDPWYADRLLVFAGGFVSVDVALATPHAASVEGEAPQLDALLIGGTAWPGGDPDHHATLSVGGQVVADAIGDGLAALPLAAALPADATQAGNVDVRVRAEGDVAYQFHIVNVERVSLSYPRLAAASADRWSADSVINDPVPANAVAPAPPGAQPDLLASTGFEDGEPALPASIAVGGFSNADVVAYRRSDGTWTRVVDLRVAPRDGAFGAWLPYRVASGDGYWVSTRAALHAPRIEAESMAMLPTLGGVEYLVVAHPLFVDALAPLLAARQAEGLQTALVTVDVLYREYGDGAPDPAAIRRFLRESPLASQARYVLLVGADTYDYQNVLGAGSVSFVPTPYLATGDVMRYTPADASYADRDDDGLPDLAIGRLPVRTVAELQLLVGKLLGYPLVTPAGAAIQVAGGGGTASLPFFQIANAFDALMLGPWTRDYVYVDALGAPAARQALLAAFDAGPALIDFIGHSAPSQWTFDPIFNTGDAAGLGNTGRPSMVVQWGCWNTYYVSPTANTLAHVLLLSGDRGAAGVYGAVALSDSSSHEALGLQISARIAPGVRIGDAVLAAKRELARTEPGRLDVIIGSTLLGDPAMPIR